MASVENAQSPSHANGVSHASLVGLGLHKLAEVDIDKYSPVAMELDLSDNSITDPAGLQRFKVLRELILDKNKLTLATLQRFPVLKSVDTLWLNNNALDDLPSIMDALTKAFPNLSYLSMLRNPACPDVYFSDGAAEAYRRYRYYVIYRIPSLKFLDSTAITSSEREEAQRVGQYMRVAAPKTSAMEAKAWNGPDLAKDSGRSSPADTNGVIFSAPVGKPAAFLARGRLRYDGSHSEGNRFIVNDDL